MSNEHHHDQRRTSTMPIRPHHHLRVLVALATLGLASFGLVTSASARTTPKSTASGHSTAPKPTVVLVHGAFADSSGWYGVIDQLHRDGYPVRAAPDPLLGLQFDAATVRGFLDSIKGPKVLVGHSYGGAVITQAASGDPDVKALVYAAAFAPARGEVLSDLLKKPVAHPIAPLPLVPVPVTQPDGTMRTDIYLDRPKFRARFAGDLSRRLTANLAATQPPTSAAAFAAKLTVKPAWETIPSWFLVAKQDKAIAPDLERFMARRIHAHTSEIKSSHAIYISHPKAVARLAEQAARATR
jgi:pimeloyl-ACP methyl ester carboxylesterase